jgi:hypothetical protein
MTRPRKIFALGIVAAFIASDVFFGSEAQFANRAVLPLGLSLDLGFNLVTPAEARIGRPRTPHSYAGVARRTARRTVRRTARRVARRTAIRIAVLPVGCVYGPYYDGYYYNCAGVYYVKSSGVYVQVVFD